MSKSPSDLAPQAPPPSRTIRFGKPLLSPLGLANNITMEGCEDYGDNKHESPPPPFSGRLSPHRTSRPLVSILKRAGCGNKKDKRSREVGAKSIVHSFEISVIPYRSSCCRAIVCIEHITDWLDESCSDGHCPSCKAPCTFESSTGPTATPTPRPVSVSPKSEKQALAVRWLEEEEAEEEGAQDAKSHIPIPIPIPAPAPPYTPFGTDDEGYPVTEHSVVLGSPLFATDMSEGFVRVTSIAGLTLFLFALLS